MGEARRDGRPSEGRPIVTGRGRDQVSESLARGRVARDEVLSIHCRVLPGVMPTDVVAKRDLIERLAWLKLVDGHVADAPRRELVAQR